MYLMICDDYEFSLAPEDILIVVLMWFIFYNSSKYVTDFCKRYVFMFLFCDIYVFPWT